MIVADKTVIITGAAQGIGAALARTLDTRKPKAVTLLDLDVDKLDKLAAELTCRNIKVGKSDVSDPEALTPFVKEMESEHDGVDLFCANAGIFPSGGEDASLDIWHKTLDINLMSHVYAARACLPHMLEKGSGYFLHTISAAGLLSQIGSAPYTVSKHGALAFAEWLSITYADRGIGVTALCPQGVDTPMLQDIANVGSVAGDGLVSAVEVAECALKAIAEEKFLALPHPMVADYFRFKASDHDRWLKGMRRLRDKLES